MIPSVIEWKTAQLLNKVGSNEDLYRLAVFQSRWHKLSGGGFMTSWWSHVSHDITELCRDIVSLPPASEHRCQTRVLRQIPTTGSWIAVISFPGYLSGRNQGTDNTLLTTSQVVAPPAAQWHISHPTFAGEKKLNQLSVRFRFLGCRPGNPLLTLCTLASSEPRQMPANVRTKVRHFSELI